MSLSSTHVMQSIGQQLRWLNERQSLVAQNVANSDTPDYKARDLRALSFESVLQSPFEVNVKRTNKSHFGNNGSLGSSAGFRTEQARMVYEASPDGNNINLQEQLVKMSEIKEQHTLLTNIARKYRSMHNVAIRSS